MPGDAALLVAKQLRAAESGKACAVTRILSQAHQLRVCALVTTLLSDSGAGLKKRTSQAALGSKSKVGLVEIAICRVHTV